MKVMFDETTQLKNDKKEEETTRKHIFNNYGLIKLLFLISPYIKFAPTK